MSQMEAPESPKHRVASGIEWIKVQEYQEGDVNISVVVVEKIF